MSTEVFLSPRLTGARFSNRAIPLEFLRDLAVLEEMIVEVAKSEYLNKNPERKRSPRGFTEGIELKLTNLEDGSAKLTISLVTAGALFSLNQHIPYFESAREAVLNAIRAAEVSQPMTDHLPEKSLCYFDRMGRSLRDGEAIEFTSPKRPTPARLTKETRRRLVLASKAEELTEETTVYGSVPEADQQKKTFEIQVPDDRRIPLEPAAQHYDTVLEAFNGYREGVKISLHGIGRFKRNGSLFEFDSVEHVSILDALDIPARLDELKYLKNGWLDGQGLAPAREGLDRLSRAFDRHYPDDLPPPYLYPTDEGGIQAEWTLESKEITLEIELRDQVGQWHLLDMSTDAEYSRELKLQSAEDWQWLVEQIRSMARGVA